MMDHITAASSLPRPNQYRLAADVLVYLHDSVVARDPQLSFEPRYGSAPASAETMLAFAESCAAVARGLYWPPPPKRHSVLTT